ncbi:serine/threonine-protein kinase [Streptomyces pseudovenezuelae]|uniref:non-specific serine/threonine protein kinase n=1 Tax=Streptomyces pseudovenezuelae TaxID=67350 RepID=A0ABT6LMD9_9ACTN|nr:serine/threonine-protein kinase [Streptomyces pseudovenezuelae]MDH6217475.1 putative Ser/Thr protein kinase [Streptomyces pseudovenezuelae]
MSSNGGSGHESDETTSFVLQPPNPVAVHTQVVPSDQVAPPQQAVPPQEPGTGRLIASRYRLLSKLGHGGMGTVWRAKDETVDREVAVKEPRVPDTLPERERANAFERMRREARAAARLDHPAVVNVHDVAVVDGQPWIVMELVHGRSLGDALQEGTLDAREAARVGLEVLGALEAAHAAGILHRDVKPDNVLLGRHGRVVLTDFGIAQIEGETNLTDTGGFVGSPEYIAPERVLGQRPGPSSDLWSLGVVLYAATEGVSPFRRSNTPATLQSVLNGTPAPPTSASGPLASVITGLLHKDPAHRPNAAQVRALLEETANPPTPVPTQAVQVVAPGGGGGRRTWLAFGAGVVVAAVLAGASAFVVVADPFGGSGGLPDGWKTHHVRDVAATLATPASYRPEVPDRKSDETHWVRYSDPSGAIRITLGLEKKSEDTSGDIKGSSAAQMYADNDKFRESGEYDLNMPANPKTDPKPTTYKGKQAGENTVVYQTDDSQDPLPREVRVFYYKTSAGDLYRLTVSYPGKGDFTDRGREVAQAAITNLDVDKL